MSADQPDAGCNRKQDDRRSDLCAQWKAADAAFDGAKWSFGQLVLGAFGLLIGAGTLIAAWRAAHYAKEAAEHTKTGADEARRGADAAERALAHSRETAAVQLRPYLVPTNIRATVTPTGEVTITAKIANVGTLPARNVSVVIKAAFAKIPIPRSIAPPRRFGLDYGIIPPQARPSMIRTFFYISELELASIVEGSAIIVVDVDILYRPLADKEHELVERRGMISRLGEKRSIRIIPDHLYARQRGGDGQGHLDLRRKN